MSYVDANVLVYAAHPQAHALKMRARQLLAAQEGLVTSALAIGECVWAWQRAVGRDIALRQGRHLLGMPGLAFEPIGFIDIDTALDLAAAHRLDPRDAIHAAVAIRAGGTILSDDADFDRVPDLKRLAP